MNEELKYLLNENLDNWECKWQLTVLDGVFERKSHGEEQELQIVR